jgi:hypothetical protein
MSKYWIAKKDNLFVTDAAWYDKETRNKTRQMTDIAEKVLPIIRQMLNLSIENSKVVIGFCKTFHKSNPGRLLEKSSCFGLRNMVINSIMFLMMNSAT